ncbi:protein O-linked-mannose beta-1,2-N-acetylglucosaminyltransferase 1-like [Eriocheir sinensis]|uniref:protein O-linked-mannose beta-1,2-N-acetylglucosaminyltransferase 1-like n=1 Tax=Eriocheir sinensis TaxID=95602 RepID=UPI0021C658AB|nr:protein O-linked-mannose beta-1,2-N-acetylglucosaminyltransferase 1-like [Eriocheir sinensis]
MRGAGAPWALLVWAWSALITATPITVTPLQPPFLPPPRRDGPEASHTHSPHAPRPPLLGAHAPRGHARNPLVRDHFPVKWRKIAEERSLHPVNFTALEVTRELEAETFLVQVLITKDSLQVLRDDTVVYHKDGSPTALNYLPHAGIHVVVLHPRRGDVMLARQFLTHQPSEHRNLASCLASLAPGRILVVAAVPDAVAFLGPDAVTQLEAVGASRIRNLAVHEAWAMVSHTPTRLPPASAGISGSNSSMNTNNKVSLGHTWGEAASIIRRPGRETNPLILRAHVPQTSSVWCKWHEDPAMEEQRHFCDTYEGYLRLCTCWDPITKDLRYSALQIEVKEVIPVAMLTAVKPFHFYRQLLNLLETPGAAQTPILVMVDGAREEVMGLARLFGLDVLVHRPQGAAGSTTLLNMHFRFSVHNVFNFFPEADKAVILEDDLLLSPDFLSFFQQTAWLLDADPTIFCVNAFSVNSYPTVAGDPHILRRLDMFPQFGWMVTRRWAREQYAYWIPEEHGGDWDWWLSSQHSLQGRHALVPEVGRTFHAGAAGAHVTGWFQEHFFSYMIFNQDPHVKLQGLEDLILDRYRAKLKREILNATDLVLRNDFCSTSAGPVIPHDLPGPFRVFVWSESKADEYGSFIVMQQCLNAFMDTREMFDGVVRFNLGGRVLFIVGCPVSRYCGLFQQGTTLLRPSLTLMERAEANAIRWQTRNYPAFFLVRGRSPANPRQEFLMENLFLNYFNGTLVMARPGEVDQKNKFSLSADGLGSFHT